MTEGPATARETSGATTGLVVRYVRAVGGEEAVAELLRRADVPHTVDELADDSCWVSYRTRIRLFEAAVEVLDDPRATHAIGAGSLRTGLNPSLVLLLRALGSPRQVYRQLPRAVPKFTTTSTMEVVESGPDHATLRYTLHEGYRHSRLDCLYARGLIAAVPEIFGLPPATVVHDECEADGHPACLYHVTWPGRSRLPWRRRGRGVPVDPELVALRGQLGALQSAALDLVGSEDLTGALRRITERAAAAVLAPAHLLAVTGPDGEPLVHAAGLPPEEAAELGARLLAGDDLGPGAVVVDVASRRQSYGRLAALHGPGQRGPADERAMLAAYAGHAAAALDLLVALEDSRRGQNRSAALLELAHDLRAATDPETVSRVVVSALGRIVSSDTSSILLWDPAAGELRTVATAGLPDHHRDLLLATPVLVDDTPELAEMLTRQEPTVIRAVTATPALRALLTALGLEELIAVPLVASGQLLGVVTASWRTAGHPAEVLAELVTRLGALGEYAATALENVRLLSTVRHQALHDALTGLPNRALFTRELERALARGRPGHGVTVLFCDLDRFKHINDVLGHAAGDELLRQVAGRLRAVLRSDDLVGRLGGDEFALLLPGVTDPAAARAFGERVVGCFAVPFRVDGRELRITTSVGVARHDGSDGRAELLLVAADGAMYEAKQRGRNQVALARGEARTGAATEDGQPSLEAEFRAALERGELRLHFMPIVDVAFDDGSGSRGLRLSGAEALVRWQHPRLGLLPPGAFLPLAEEAGLISDVDLWAVGEACAAVAAWTDDGVEPLHIAMNLAADTLLDPRLLGTVRGALARHGVNPARVHLEVVESRALVDVAGVVERLTDLRRLGVQISLDDFGTGFSTLAWLQRLPVDQVKIDRSFVEPLPGDAASLAVVRGVLALAAELGLDVIAEGVETSEQLEALRAAGCRWMQGYLFGRAGAGQPSLPAGLLAAPPGVLAA